MKSREKVAWATVGCSTDLTNTASLCGLMGSVYWLADDIPIEAIHVSTARVMMVVLQSYE